MSETHAKHVHHAIDYIELIVTDVAEAKRFHGAAFGWTFLGTPAEELRARAWVEDRRDQPGAMALRDIEVDACDAQLVEPLGQALDVRVGRLLFCGLVRGSATGDV